MLNQQIISRANAENLTDADMQAIKAAGLRVVHKVPPCNCNAYPDFPHRLNGGKCNGEQLHISDIVVHSSYLSALDDAGHKEKDFI